ncbi:MAG: mercuric reductase [Candidatus Binatia bacterium]
MPIPFTNSSTPVHRMMLVDDPYDRQLIENCHPSSWANPTPMGKYNLVVLGAGTAGLVSAAGAAGLGAKVALIERTLLGGDCLNVGCVPSKGIIRAARAVFDTRNASMFGIQLGSSPAANFAEVMERMRRLRADISKNDSAHRFNGLGVDVYQGNAKFVGPSTVEVGGTRLEFDRAVIATGARATELAIPGLEKTCYHTNETIFTLTELPRRMVVIGAGPIGCELAQSFQRFGSHVTLLTRGTRILPKEDADAAEIICKQMEREGMRVLFRAEPIRAERRGPEKVLHLSLNGGEEELVCDAILVGIGRKPNVEGMGLEAAGVKFSGHGVEVDDRLRTTNPRIYAAGDICSRFKFTHAADAMARIVLANALFFGRRKASTLVIPWCTYTDPEVAHVGYHEADARAAGFEVVTITDELRHVDRAVLDGEDEGFARIHYNRKNGKILGGTIVARHAGDMISELTLAITTGQKVSALASTIHPYPTQPEVLKKIGDHYMRQKLTPTVKGVFKKWFAWRR